MKIASLTRRTTNRKLTADAELRAVSVTRAAQISCAPSCPFFENGCYAEGGPSGIHSRRLNKAADAEGASALAVAEAEADAIRSDWPRDGRPLRLHEVGDCATPAAAETVSAAVAECQSRGAGKAWTYTHAAADVPRAAWGPVSVLASIETPAEAIAARAAGYAPAVVAETVGAGAAILAAAGVRGIGCPAETGAAPDCASCGLCMRADTLRDMRAGIVFTPHGSRAKLVAAAVGGKNAPAAEVAA